MAFVRPTLSELVDRVQLDLIARLDLTGAVLRRSMVYVLARVIAGAAHMMHGHLEFLARQLFPDTSEAEFLVRQAGVFGLARLAPSYATGNVTITGVDTNTAPAGSILVSASGQRYELDEDATIVAGEASAPITALEPGAAGSLVNGQVLSFESPVAGIDSAVTVYIVTADGTDEEPIESLRTRLLEHLAEPAHGGTAADYVAWAKGVAGVTRVWVTERGLGPGTVLVRFVRDGDVSPIPDSGEVAAVQAELDAKRPAHATVTVAAPIDAPVDLTLSITPDTVDQRARVEAQVAAFLADVSSPGGTILISALRTAIGSTAGLTDYTLTSPATNLTPGPGELASLGTITWI